MFLKRDGDGFDWYEYSNVEEGNERHKDRKVQFDMPASSVWSSGEGKRRQGRLRDPDRAVDASRLFPDGCRVIELTEIQREQDEDALIKEFCHAPGSTSTTGVLGEKWKPQGPSPGWTSG